MEAKLQFDVIILLLIVGVVFGMDVSLLKEKKGYSVTSLTWLAGLIFVWCLAGAFLAPDSRLLRSINHLCGAFAATAQFYVALSYTNRVTWMNRRTFKINRGAILLFILIPCLVQIIFWTARPDSALVTGPHPIISELNESYIVAILAGSNLLLWDTYARKPRLNNKGIYQAALASAVPALLLRLVIIIWNPAVDTEILLSVLSYSAAFLGFRHVLMKTSEIDLFPISREDAVEHMDDGWMVVDPQNRVVDLNSAAADLIGFPYERIYGEPINKLLPDWSKLIESPKVKKEVEVRRSIRAQADWRYLNIHISQLSSQENAGSGHLVLWRDITRRKIAEDARRHAKDDVMTLMNAVSNAASRNMNQEDFLNDAVYQMVYSFQGQAAAILLMGSDQNDQPRLSLRAQFGLSLTEEKELQRKTLTGAMQRWLYENEEGNLLIMSRSGGAELPSPYKNLNYEHLVVLPLIIRTQNEKSPLGCFCMGRDQAQPFTQDELVRLDAVSAHLAVLIDNDQRRQYANKIKERDRLQRDLHDSVSQKLYALLALTQAAQATIEAGKEVDTDEVLTRIGEHARQSVKEMRLVLHEMQPPDLNDGLVSALHHRLNAVEGRSSMQHSFIASESIQLTKQAELALYQVAQEALNNILRHAKANKVTLALRQTRTNVILTIQDDGIGFEPAKVKKGGHGLGNMQERIRQLDGRIKIDSAPGKGTTISITVNRKK